MNTGFWWLWIVLGFVVISLIIWLIGRAKVSPPANMAHLARPDEKNNEDSMLEKQVVDAGAVSGVIQNAPSPDDLIIIEGIGPKIAALLNSAGITTFSALATVEITRLDEILTQANLRSLAAPDTWPKQAALAAEGRWDELKQYQNALKGGREN